MVTKEFDPLGLTEGATLAEEKSREILKMLKTTPLSTRDVFNMSVLLHSEQDAALHLHHLERHGKITVQDGLWRTIHTRDSVRNLAAKCSLLERLAMITSDDIADQLREIAGDLTNG
jgi:hypothetical protein